MRANRTELIDNSSRALIFILLISIVATLLSVFRPYHSDFVGFSWNEYTTHLAGGRPAPFILFPSAVGGIIFSFYGFLYDIAFYFIGFVVK
ncbi:MAG: hypothetical protein M1526_04860 [Candidatus Thermoplasmatota archaeon]|jgi:hypothetical protein|nr:hypothetical protein [Candidatus Thermoplasmatota archaeon]MCL5681366.1 hypothetical protein [Candidatus Thermoplasmatota archaeon]